MGKEDLIKLEQQADTEISGLTLIPAMPVRAMLASIHLIVDGLYYGRFRAGQEAQRDKAESLISRLAYAVPLLRRCPPNPIDDDAQTAAEMIGVADPDGEQFKKVIAYLHFCQVMPEVHRDYWNVETVNPTSFVLAHANRGIAEVEAKDFVLSELALPFSFSGLHGTDAAFDEAVRLDAITPELQIALMRQLYHVNLESMFETPILTEEGFHAALGVPREQFIRFRASLFAISDFFEGMAAAASRALAATGFDLDSPLGHRAFNSVSVCMEPDALSTIAKALGDYSQTQWERMSQPFILNLTSNATTNRIGEGFFQPLTSLDNRICFSPLLIRTFLAERNIVYWLNRTDQRTFHNNVSAHLEPQLIHDAKEALERFPNLRIVSEVDWSKEGYEGEIDILVYDELSNTALHLQGKATVPPQGARMIQTLESRIAEGLKQLKRLRDLKRENRDLVLSEALNKAVSKVVIQDVVLARTCFGTHKIWSANPDVLFITLPLLTLYANRLLKEGNPFDLRLFAGNISRLLNDLVDSSHCHWVNSQLHISDADLTIPMLHHDSAAIRKARIDIWKRAA